MLQKRSSDYEAKIAGPIARILDVQRANGMIPWFEDGPWDSWNHGECVMALAIAGEKSAARLGLDALANEQRRNGGFLCEYGNALPMADHVSIARVESDKVLDTNFTAYVASVVEHFRLLNGSQTVREYWPMVRSAINHVLENQHPQGDISWSAEAHGTEVDDALIAGNASIFSSLGHAVSLAEAMGDPQVDWAKAQERLGHALREQPERFGRSGQDRGSHAMDWYYPVLSGLYGAADGAERIGSEWPRFVDEGLGCRCVADQPWVTVAETCELIIASLRCGMEQEAAMLFNWIEKRCDGEGAFWMGWQHVELINWPAERLSWTQAAYVLALDAFEEITPAAKLFAD